MRFWKGVDYSHETLRSLVCIELYFEVLLDYVGIEFGMNPKFGSHTLGGIINDLSRYKQQLNTLKGFEICDCILSISKQSFMLHIL